MVARARQKNATIREKATCGNGSDRETMVGTIVGREKSRATSWMDEQRNLAVLLISLLR